MRAADYIVDIGPGAGVHGGEVVAAGTVEDIMACAAHRITGQYLSRRKEDRGARNSAVSGNGKFIAIVGATREQPEEYRRENSAGRQ